MKILQSSKVHEVDEYTIKNEPVVSVDLMERAALACAGWIINNFNNSNVFKTFVGPGNNGGDGLAIARMLADNNYKTEVYIIKITDNLKGDSLINYERLVKQGIVNISFITEENQLPEIKDNDIIIDALFGSGLTRSLNGLPARVVKFLNRSNSEIIAIDIPSGLFGEDNSENDYDNIIKAKWTLSFQFPSLSFFFSENDINVGEWIILPIGLHKGFIEKIETKSFYVTEEFIKSFFAKKRNKFAHKGNFGHALLISGGYGKMGAAILGSSACLRTGIGLLTTHIPIIGYTIMQTAIPEVMVSIDKSELIYSELPDIEPYNAIGIGPGLGMENSTCLALKELLSKSKVPLVIDADGINILAKNKNWLKIIPGESILTPHPKEFERLFGKSSDNYLRTIKQAEYSKKYNIYIVLKGAHTVISCPNGEYYFNTTGNPGMATAGSGDVLTGIILSLLGQGYSPGHAAIAGVYLHGLAGDLAEENTGEESLIAGDIIQNLGKAFKLLKTT